MANNESQPKKPIRLRYLTAKTESFDSLYHTKVNQPAICLKEACLGSILTQHVAKSTGTSRPVDEVLVHAKDFLDQYFASIKSEQEAKAKLTLKNGLATHMISKIAETNKQAHEDRWKAVQEEVRTTGTYQLTETELSYGTKLAWRNAARCIGRIQWSRLQVFDCRSVTTTSGMFEALCNHIKYATNKGNIRSAITVFPQRTDGKHDFRIWNSQLISYACYKNPDGTYTGDPAHAEFTEECIKLGWKGKGTNWDILPLVLSANGHDPDWFDVPPELVFQVPLTHPEYDWFPELDLRWYALPAVSNMMFDCGGLQFTAAPFSGWYMNTEIGARDLCDTTRYNMLEPIAKKMGLDTNSPISLWKDKAMVECNVAVLHSFQQHNTTIVDHHTASESFMKHLDNEQRLRQGCPADWVWLVPPMSGSISPLFHQEMAHYTLYPTYSYQEDAWKVHVWGRGKNGTKEPRPKRKFHFKQIARAVKFTSRLFRMALSKRIKATIIFATETGTSEGFAKKLNEVFSHAFNSQVVRMDEYDINSMEHEALLLVVCSTFGNGDPPEMGKSFFQQLKALRKEQDDSTNNSSASLVKAYSRTDSLSHMERTNSFRASVTDTDAFGLLNNVRFAVFALGSSAFPNFCTFGINVDRLVGELGGERLMMVTLGDEMHGQQQTFLGWAPEVFKKACDVFCLDETPDPTTPVTTLPLTGGTVRFVSATATDLKEGLAKCYGRQVYKTSVAVNRNLHGSNSSITTLGMELDVEGVLKYDPGDHVGVFPCNRKELVDGVLSHLDLSGLSPDKSVELQLLKETQTLQGVTRKWDPHEKLPRASLRMLLTRYCDLTTPPMPQFLQFLATCTNDPEDKDNLLHLAMEPTAYEDWRHWRYPHMLEVLEQFTTVRPPPALFVAQLSSLQPRFYSLSSSPLPHPTQVHLTVGVVSYRTQDGKGPMHYGVCSNYLKETKPRDPVYIFHRSAPNFHLPEDQSLPMIWVGPGTGIAPFRGFWQHKYALLKKLGPNKMAKTTLFFGARLRSLDLYSEEKQQMLEAGVFDKVFLALSREPNIPKTYVQNLMIGDAKSIYQKIVTDKGHFFVCGDVTMAEGVWRTLKTIIQTEGGLTVEEVENYIQRLKNENRAHEDIFGITLRTKEVHNRSREAARIRMASQSNP